MSFSNSLRQLAKCISDCAGVQNQVDLPIEGMLISRWEHLTNPASYTLNASICLIAQGQKQVILGEQNYNYDPQKFLVSSVDLPVMAHITRASTQEPFLGVVMQLDLQEIAQLITESKMSFAQSAQAQPGIGIGELSEPLLNAFVRLFELLDEPEHIDILAPVIKREIFYRLLMTNQGQRLYQLTVANSHSQQVAKAIDWLKSNYTQPLSIGELSDYVGMSKSAFHQHFRLVTAMTPLQFQKKLRLNEARRLMLIENLGASEATFKVGYESPSQFSREYSRLFGRSPVKDIRFLTHQDAS
ncbi:AraC family transcriptional regulator N-terminal domain-containing protein [Celerinatantimonas sp. MCCC 1A17872]|uniref:AraC family transcriptional regulator n=1 Tax=Celerinatantimonas sp. MCCC 1A17872 TaxID=3177514 RepID=UPI0038C4516C